MSRPHSFVLKSTLLLAFLIILLAFTGSFAATPPATATPTMRLDLRTGWQVQSACVLQGSTTGPAGLKGGTYPALDGETLSSPLYRPIGWIPATVPTTVVAAQVAAGIIKDPFYGMNLRKLPGMDYPIGSQFANLAMTDDSPYKCGWWYRTQFRLPAGFAGRSVALHLDGVNYRADVWLNGKQLANRNEIAGTWRVFELNLAGSLASHSENILAIKVFPPTTDDLAITWVDWNPAPPDKNTGLFRDVYLTASGPVQLRFPYVANKLDDSFTTAQLTPVVEAWNATGHAVKADIAWEIDGKKIHQEVTLDPEQKKTVFFAPEQFPELTIKDPKLWWPAEMGTPTLYHARVSATVDGRPSESRDVTFGIRQVTSELNNQHTLFKINGKPILIRGGGWAPDMLLRSSPQIMDTEFRYVRDLGLNTIRLEGKLESQAFYDLADKYGILVMAGWCCCDMWETLERVGPGTVQDRAGCNARPDAPAAQSSQHAGLAQWQRQSAHPLRRVHVPLHRQGADVAESLSCLRHSAAYYRHRPIRREDDRPLRLRSAYLLAHRYQVRRRMGIQHRDQSRALRFRLPQACAGFCRRTNYGRRMKTWGLHEGGERFQTITLLQHVAGAALRRAERSQRLRTQSLRHGLRGRARHVRGLCPQQVQLHRSHSVDAEQRLALAHLASVRLLSRSRPAAITAPKRPTRPCTSCTPMTLAPSWS